MPELLIVDDDEALRRWEERVVRDQGYSCDGAGDAPSVRLRLEQSSYDLALLDVNIPGESGMELLTHIRSSHPDVAVMMVTGEDSTELALTAIEQGAYGYLIKPVAAGELLINVANALHRRRGELQNQRLVRSLRATAEERGHKLEEALQDLELSETKVWVSQAETIFRLARMVEFRDEETGHHLNRMSSYCEILARRMGFSEEQCERMRLASQLHDVGKVAIPDSILLKPGKLTTEEFEIVKGHAQKGFRDALRLGVGGRAAGRFDRPHSPRALGREWLSPWSGRRGDSRGGTHRGGGRRVRRADQRPGLPLCAAGQVGHCDDALRTWPPLRSGDARLVPRRAGRRRIDPAGVCRLMQKPYGPRPRLDRTGGRQGVAEATGAPGPDRRLRGAVAVAVILRPTPAPARTAHAQSALDCAPKLLDREGLDQCGREGDPEVGELGRRSGDARADQRQRGVDQVRGLREHPTDRIGGLDDEHVGAGQLLGRRRSGRDRLVAEARDHPLQQSPEIVVGLADQYSCHGSMIGGARMVPGGGRYEPRMSGFRLRARASEGP